MTVIKAGLWLGLYVLVLLLVHIDMKMSKHSDDDQDLVEINVQDKRGDFNFSSVSKARWVRLSFFSFFCFLCFCCLCDKEFSKEMQQLKNHGLVLLQLQLSVDVMWVTVDCDRTTRRTKVLRTFNCWKVFAWWTWTWPVAQSFRYDPQSRINV